MRLRKEVLKRLDNNKGVALVMATLDVAATTAREYVKRNSDNLTKTAMVKAIMEEFGLTEEQILQEDKVGATK
jgi:hypothetical protein